MAFPGHPGCPAHQVDAGSIGRSLLTFFHTSTLVPLEPGQLQALPLALGLDGRAGAA